MSERYASLHLIASTDQKTDQAIGLPWVNHIK